jgi:murein DD-endopeptidase MepM/ murein hydrolase activator NlpD
VLEATPTTIPSYRASLQQAWLAVLPPYVEAGAEESWRDESPAATALPSLGPTDTAAEDSLPVPSPEPLQAPVEAATTSGSETQQEPTPGSYGGWPVRGPISSYFGPAHPLGIDIDLFSNPNAPIGAVRSGEVTFAGGNSCCSYGLYVIVDHGDGLETLYAHLSRIVVSRGQTVNQEDVLGYGGRTGYATGNHLHFEVRVNGTRVNPLSYLPQP